MNFTKHRVIILIISIVFCLCIQTNAQIRLKYVYPFIGLNRMEIKWSIVLGAQEYEYRKKENNNAYSPWISAALSTSIQETNLSITSLYTYQVRVKVGGVWSNPSNEKKNGLAKVWPVRKTNDCITESIELLHNFGQPIGVGTNKYFHEGIDINGESSLDNECVKSPVGGIVIDHGGSGSNISVNLQVYINGGTKYIQFNHLKNLSTNLVDGESVEVGELLGLIADGPSSGSGWTTLSSHTHCHYFSTYTDLLGTAMNPLNIWDDSKYRDPHGLAPLVLDTNGDGEAIKFRKTPNSTDYFLNDGNVHNGVDIVVEAIDKQSSDPPWQTPKVVGYYIQRQQNNSWKDIVKTSSAPYILIDNDIYYQTNSSTPNVGIINTIVDYKNDLKGTPPNTPSAYVFDQWFTYIVTNTRGTTGAIADLDSNQYWATDARNTVSTDNGYINSYAKARSIDEAKFPDSKYRVNIRLADFINTSSDYQKEIIVDNFRPYIKKVEIKGGKLNYVSSWNWNTDTGQLEFNDNSNTDRGCGIIKVKIITSEPMNDISLDIPSLVFSIKKSNPLPNTDGKEWEFEIPLEKTKDANEGPHKLLIDGHDMNGNVLQGFTSKNNISTGDIYKRNQDGSWTPDVLPVKDNIYEFKIERLIDQINVTTSDQTSCAKPDGKATISVSGSNSNFEYSLDGGAYQAMGEFNNLTKGNHIAYVRNREGGCEFTKNFTIKEASNALKVNISGLGTTQFCNNANPPKITLTATATGGSGDYNYTWPGGTITVSSSGRQSVTVTDKQSGCTASLGGDIIFVPVVCSSDPNDIIGPQGYGPSKMIAKAKLQSYMIRFENDPDFATAPAQIVKINHPLDNNVNPFSLRLGDFGFGGLTFTVPPDKTFYSTRLDVTSSLGIVVDVTAGIDAVKKEAFWIFEAKDPVTGLPPTTSNLGFLPVNDSTSKGEGYVTYVVKAANFTKTGDVIHAKASIVFDVNGAIETPEIANVIDAVAPTSHIKALPASSEDTTIDLSWEGQDDAGGSGLRDYDVYVSENNNPFVLYQAGLTGTSTTFPGVRGSTYKFYTLGNDNVGNQEEPPTDSDAQITIGCSLSISISSTTITVGQSATLTATGCTGIVTWNAPGSGNQLVINPIVTTIYTATCSTSNSCSATSSGTVTVIQLPDMRPITTADGNTFNVKGSGDVVVSITNLGSVPTTAPVIFVIQSLEPAFAIAIPASATSVAVNGNTSVSNGDWIIDQQANRFVLTLKPGIVIPAQSSQRVGISLQAIGSPGSKALLSIRVANGTGGGETRTTNNTAKRLLSINLLN